ncbi:MAG: T9SS type A sorting domain-containing protein [Calditrichaeota bacterium]|nr:T9SS type A sorting domain-containing protein [Calditrichota bacterium]
MGYGRVNAYNALMGIQTPYPPAPTGLYIVNEDEMDEPVELDWNNVAGATSYKIYWRILYYPGYPQGDWSHIGTTPQSYYTDYGAYVSYISQHYLQYYVTAVNCGGESDPSYTATCHGDVYKRIVEDEGENIPESYGLEPNYPNPFNPATAIRYDLPEASSVSLTIYDMMGREVKSWRLQETAGYKQVVWDGKDQSGRLAPAGIYIYRFIATSVESDKRLTASRKMVLLK